MTVAALPDTLIKDDDDMLKTEVREGMNQTDRADSAGLDNRVVGAVFILLRLRRSLRPSATASSSARA
ncbi:hypothetical protein ACIA8E_09020 [Streptomyces sp. NPDC051664]|uniref:hypothetical protein n=1 Tax=Streptomyces sp. NPDC051664 TaxID=3365668 RepID=UPI00379B0D53